MRYVTSTIAACLLASAVVVFAQEQAPPQPPQPPTREPAPPPLRESAPKATLTGCVGQAKTTDGATAYVLTKAEGGSASMYVLAGPSQSEVSANVNKKIEVTGPVQEPASASEGSAAADPKILRPPLILVESVKVVAQSCT